MIDAELLEAWTAKAGDVVFLRLRDPISLSAWKRLEEDAERIETKTGVHLILLDPTVEVVNPKTGETA